MGLLASPHLVQFCHCKRFDRMPLFRRDTAWLIHTVNDESDLKRLLYGDFKPTEKDRHITSVSNQIRRSLRSLLTV
jgi:hypothetical protein